jgi:hypothetical protein
LDVRLVFLSEEREAHLDPGQVDVASASQGAGGQNFALDFVGVFGQDFHVDFPVVDQDHVIDIDVIDEILVIDVHGMLFLALFTTNGEGEGLAGFEVERYGQVAGTDGGPLGIHENAGGDVEVFGSGSDMGHDLADPGMRGVGHVQTKNVHPSPNQEVDHFRGIGSGTEGGNYFGFSHPGMDSRPNIADYERNY